MENKIHIGELVKAQFEKRGCTVSWLARQLNCDRSNIYDIFKRGSVDTNRLYDICKALDYNFFAILADNFAKAQADSNKLTEN
ncbi:MAG: helix-turn-helix domain-containing protein [Bacteroidia bacterium]|nr:helix-turn-helix domain-containing protein [Bacteroidia bacterium]